jgi:hypothetical protein
MKDRTCDFRLCDACYRQQPICRCHPQGATWIHWNHCRPAQVTYACLLHHQTTRKTIFDAFGIDSAVLNSSTQHGSVGRVRPAQQQLQMALQCVQDSLDTNWVSVTTHMLCIQVILHAVGLCGLFARHSRVGVEQHRPQGALLDLPLLT